MKTGSQIPRDGNSSPPRQERLPSGAGLFREREHAKGRRHEEPSHPRARDKL